MAKHVSAYRGAGLKPNRVTKKPKQDWVSAYKRDDEKNRGGLIGGLGYVGGNLGLGIAGIGEGVGDLISAGGDLLRGDTEMAKYRFLDNKTAEAQQSLRDWYNPGTVMEFAGDVASGIGQSSVFLLDAVAPGVGTGLFFAGVGGQGISSAAARTGDVGWREVGYGVASGAAEGALELALGAGSKVAGKLGASITRKAGTAIGQKGITTALTKSAGKRAWSSIAKATAKDAAGEFGEEFASEYIDTALLHAFGIDPNASTSFGEAVRAGMVGLFSGGIMGAPANVINYKNAAKAGRTIRESGETENLLNRAQATVSVLREQEAVKKAEGKKVKKTDEATDAAEQKGFLARQGAKREARRAAEYAAKLEKNVNAYRNMKAEMRNSEVGDALLGELRGNLYFTNMAYAVEEAEIVLRNVDDAQAQKIVDYINTEAKKAKQEKSDYTVEDFRLNRDGILSQFAAKGRMEQLINGEWTEAEEMAAQAAEAAKATESPVEAAETAGAVTGEEVDTPVKKTNEKAVWTNPGTTEDEKVIYKVAHDFGLSETETNMMLASFKKGTAMDADTFAKAYSEGIFRGRRGQNPADVTPGSLLASMNPYERQEAFEAGRMSEIETEDLREAAAKQKKAPARQTDKQGKTSFVTLELAEGVHMRDLSPEAYQTYNAAKVIGEALHTDIVLHSTLGDVNGKKQNGYYNRKTGEIHIALDAGRGANGTALFTLAHEVTHYIKEWSPRKYQALADFVSERISGELDVLVERKVNLLRTLPDYENMTVSQLNDAAHEEVVADSMETVLSDGNVLEDLATYDNSIWQKVKTWITKAIKNIKAVYESLSPNSRAAQVLSETMTDMEKLERLFTEGVREAGERTRTAGEVAVSEGERRYSIDETTEAADVSDSAFDEALRRAGLSHLVEDTAEADEIAPPPSKVPQERDPEEDRRDRIRAHETLANALMESAQNENEFRLVKNYQKKIAELADAEIRKDDLIKKTAAVNREIDLLKSKKDSIDRERPEPEVKEAEAWIENELNEAIARKQSFLEELNELDDKLRTETDKLLTLASTKQLRKMFRAERSKAAAMERSAERSRQRELSTKAWAKETVKKAREEANEKKRESREWAKETVRNIRKESNEKIYKARREATDYKAAVYHTAYAKADEKNQKYRDRLDEMAKRSMERREITIRMREARRVLGYLNTMLYHPTKQKHVPESLQALVDKTLRAADPKQFGINRDHIREMSELAGKIRKLESKAGRTTAEQETLDKMKTKYEKLEADTISVKRQAEALMTAFEQYVTSTADGEQIDKNMLEGLRQTVTEIEEAPLNEMTLKSLQAVEKIYTVIYHQVNTANQAFATEKAASIDQMSTKANTQVKEAKSLKFLSPKPMEIKGKNSIRRFFWKNMKPLTVFEAIGSEELMSIFKRVLDGEDVWITDILEAKKALDEAKKKYGYNKWNFKERREVTTADGSKVSLTLGEMMSLYAYMFREQAEEHLSAGGFVFAPDAKSIEKFKDSKVLYEAHLNDQTPHRMRKEDIAKMSEMLTQEQRAYAEAVQKYLTGLGAKGNEVSRKLYGIDLFKETAYFPIKSSHDYIETSTGKSGDPNIKSRGTFKETVPGAGNPIVLEDFMEVVGNHVNTMATYHAFVLPVEDLTRVWNYTPVNIKRDADGKAILDENGMPVADTEGAAGYNSLKAEITKKYGKEANDYILQLLRDLNGGARRESAASILDKGLTAFKRSATMLSLSTIVQQPTSIIRAMAYVDAKHFTGASFVPWETVKKYAPVAAIKEMGGFDTGTGARTAEFINAKEYDNIKDAAKAAVTPEIYGGDPNVRAEAFGWLTGKADEVSWRYMFGAIVNEQAEKLGKPKESEEVMKAAGERFAEVVRRTQVYDSTLTRSEYMRSKDGLMKMATAFGAEPTTVVSMVADAIIKAERGDKTFLRKSAAGIAFSVIANAAVVSLIYAMRDDDEDETIPEKYVQSLTSELIEGFNFFEYLPVARDVVSLFKGYEIERSDMALVGNLMDQVELITSSKRSVPDKIFGVTGAVSAFFGLPVTNVYRDFKGLVKTGQSFTNAEKQTGAGFGFAMGDAVSGQFNLFAKLFGAESGNNYELYTAYVRGDTAHYNRVKARYEDEKAAEQALRKELRENDRRIGEAAKARMNGETELYESIVRAIVSDGIFDRNMVIRAVNNEISALERELEKGILVPEDPDTEETPESLYKASDLNAALERGDRADFELIYDTILGERMEQGKTEAQAKAAVKSSITAYWKKQYLSGYQDTETRKRIIKLLTDTGLYGSRNDVATMCEGWVRAKK